MSYSSVILADTPHAYWRLGEASAASPADNAEGTAALDGTYVGTPTMGAAGAVTGGDTSIVLNGTTQWVSVPDNAALDFGDVLSIELWCKKATGGDTAERMLISKGQDGYALDYSLGGNSAICFNKDNSSVIVTATTTITDTLWHYVVLTKNGATVKLYLDAVDVTGTVTNATIADTATGLLIGDANVGGAGPWAGGVDEVALYAYALTSSQVTAHYAAAFVTGPVWVSPADTVAMNLTPVLQFTSPTSSSPQHFELQLDTANTFDTGNLQDIRTDASQTRWEYWNGSVWTAFPPTGLPSGSSGNDVRYIVSPALSATTWYRRVRAGS